MFLVCWLVTQLGPSAYSQQLSDLKLSFKSKSIQQQKRNLHIRLPDSNNQSANNTRLSMGLGFFGHGELGILALSLNFLPDLGQHIFASIGMISYTYIQKGEPPNASLGLQAMYNLCFINNKLNLYAGGGLFMALFNDLGFIASARADYSLSNIVAVGGELKYLLSRWKVFKYPGFFINCTFNVSPSSKKNKFERR